MLSHLISRTVTVFDATSNSNQRLAQSLHESDNAFFLEVVGRHLTDDNEDRLILLDTRQIYDFGVTKDAVTTVNPDEHGSYYFVTVNAHTAILRFWLQRKSLFFLFEQLEATHEIKISTRPDGFFVEVKGAKS